MNTLKFYLFTSLVCSFTSLFAQNTILGKVLNERTKEGVPFATVHLLNSTNGVPADENGVFQLKLVKKHSNDTLVFAGIGYKSLKLALMNFSSPLEVYLQEDIKTLREVAISDKRKESQIGNFNVASDVKILNTGIEIAKRFVMPATHQYLKEILIRRDPIYYNQSPETRFRVNIYEENPQTKGPGKKICLDTIEVNDIDNNKISISVARYNISISNAVFFISVETLLTPYNERYRIYRAGKVVEGVREYTPYYEVCYQPHLSVGRSKENEGWVLPLFPGSDWRRYEYAPAIIAIVN